MASYSLDPVEVPAVNTPHRTIKTKLPVPESLPIFARLEQAEPRSMRGQPPVIWHTAEGATVGDAWGNRWIDWSSCVLVANAGHGRKEIADALRHTVDQGLLSTYVFAHEGRAALCEKLQTLSPAPADYTVFLLSTGSEATENCIKMAKTYALQKYGPQKKYFVTFSNGFHGRTMGAQLAGGIPALKTWIGDLDPTFVQVPFPDGYRHTDTSFDGFLASLAEQGVKPQDIAGVMTESYQGAGPHFLPVDYAQKLQALCREHDIVMCYDEVQAGFGRSGKMFTYEHYGVTPDLVACGKGISSSLPLSAVIGRRDILDLYPPGSMTSTHSASPLPVAAAVASLDIIEREGLVANAARLGDILMPELHRIAGKYPDRLAWVTGKGLVAGIQTVHPGTKEPDGDTATAINLACFHRGLLMFAPVGMGGSCIKVAPPLCITDAALRESIAVFEEACDAVLG